MWSNFGRALRPTALIVVLAAMGAAAQSLEVLGPTGAVAPDGFAVALLERAENGQPRAVGAPAVAVDGASILRTEPAPPLQTFWVTPKAGVHSVWVRAQDGFLTAEAKYDVGPPAAVVALDLVPATPVKNRDNGAELTVRLLKADGSPDPDSTEPVLRANVGRVEGLARTGPGTYRARYVLPETRFPEVAVIVAFAPWPHPQSIYGAIGSLLVPLASAIDLPGKTERNARTSVEIAGINYGPVQAGPDGRFKLPVVVPPGHRYGRGTAVDRAGNRRTMQVDLQLPPTDQLSCVHNPTWLPANGTAQARILCVTSDPYGKPLPGADVQMVVRRGTLEGPRRLEEGLLEWIYTSPSRLGDPDLVTATWRQAGSNSRDELAVGLVQGPAMGLSLSSAEDVAHFGGRLHLSATVEDGMGRPRPGAALALAGQAGGSFSSGAELAPGQLTATWELPSDGTPGPSLIQARAFGPRGKEPAQLGAWLRDGVLFAGVSDLAGLPVPAQRLWMNGVERETGADGTVSLGPAQPGKVELKLEAWPALRRTLYVLDANTLWPRSVPSGASQSLAIRLAPAVPVNVRVKVQGHVVTFWVEDAKGDLLIGRAVALEVTGGRAGPRSESNGRFRVTVEPSGPSTTVSVADRATGVTALAEVAR